ncbi:1,5-anhydro-D-fructose reductase [Hetaerina americana]|uniref:1,5-anhydro-D-fructose reductase n=1 Tax=Hetaerina americana TaxID=62018 RepID=UPI003A7F4A2D
MADGKQICLDLTEGVKIPALGFGTWQSSDEELEKAIDCALKAGYRHIDTAYAYENEKALGRVLKKWIDSGKIKREDLFIVTKLPEIGNRPSGVVKYLQRSLDYLQLSYVDLYLVHTPFGYYERGEDLHPMTEEGVIDIDVSTDHNAIWKAMEDQVLAGKARSIGISNFNEKQIERIWNSAERIKPSMLQVELHLYFQQKDLVNFCHAKNIKVCAYSPLGSRGSSQLLGKELPDVLNNEVVKEIAEKHGKTPAQILLRHIIQRGVAAIPKSTNPQRILQNIQVFDFELSSEDMNKLNDQDQGKAGRILDFSFFKGVPDHPEYPF